MPSRVDILERLKRRVDQDRYRQIYANRDLAMSRVHWIGFDMDYTLAIYRREVLDALVHELTCSRLVERFDYPDAIGAIPFDPDFAIRGLVIDKKTGYLLKMDSFRHVTRGVHGLSTLPAEALEPYRKDPPNLSHSRYALLDTLFELPEAYIFSAVVDHELKAGRAPDYDRIATEVREVVDSIHADGSLKAEIMADPERYIYPDPELALALHRFRSAGKKLFLMTNSYAPYTDVVMRFLLDGRHADYPDWRAYFDVIITGASKPRFFRHRAPFLRLNDAHQVIGEERGDLQRGIVYQHGNLVDFEKSIGLGRDEVLYIGDHIYGDILRSRRDSGWRTCMIVPEVELELRQSRALRDRIREWNAVEIELQRMRDSISFETDLLTRLGQDGENGLEALSDAERAELEDTLRQVRRNADRMNRKRKDLIAKSRALEDEVETGFHPVWGPLFKQGNEHSIFGEQVETYACLYTSRVSNFLYYSPLHYHRSPRDLLPHEISITWGTS